MPEVGIMGFRLPGAPWGETLRAAGLAEQLGYSQYMHRIGFGAEADRVRQAFQARDREGAARLVSDEMVDAMTILGPPDACRAQMQSYFDAGVREVRLVFNEPDAGAYLTAMKAVAPRG